MINVIEYDDEGSLPVSIIIPLSKKREKFFYDMVFPMLEANMVSEIIINNNEGTAPKKRNDGFDKSTQPYVFFCDDDVVLPASYIKKLLQALKSDGKYGYAYSGYYGIVVENRNHPIGRNFKIETKKFNANALKQSNYISTMSLIRREVFPRFDESLKRLQDYDIWLTLLRKDIIGIAVPNIEFFAYYLDEGITSNSNSERDAIMKIINKHKLGSW